MYVDVHDFVAICFDRNKAVTCFYELTHEIKNFN